MGRSAVRLLLAFATLALFHSAQAAVPTLYPGGRWQPGPARYGAQIADDVPVTMDDGTVLRASVAWPTDMATGRRAEGRFPVIVEHTPYIRLGQPVVPNVFFTQHGYIYVVVRARGTGRSQGEIGFWSTRDGLDGKAIVDWAAHRLDGSDGRIALHGCSYPGALALGDAAAVGPKSPVKVVVAACIGLSAQQREVWSVNGLPTVSVHNFPARTPVLMGTAPSVIGGFTRFRDGLLAGGDIAHEGTFWGERDRIERAPQIVANGIPVLLWSGWGDIVETGAVRTYTAFQNAYAGRTPYGPMQAGQSTTPRYQIVMGGWNHAQGLDEGIILEWIETWLKGVDTGIRNTATPMHLFETGTDRWINAAHYPIVAKATRWYLAGDGGLRSAVPGQPAQLALRWGDPGATDGRLSFETPVFASGTSLVGPIAATIFASSSNSNIELIGRLFDVAPDGGSTLVSKGALLGSQSTLDRERSWTDGDGAAVWPWPRLQRDDYLQPGRVYRFDLSLAPRQRGIAPGHRLRFELTTQTPTDICPATGPTPQTGGDPCRPTAPQQASLPGGIYRIMLSPDHASVLNLPELPWKALPAVEAGIPPTAWNENHRKAEPGSFTLPLDWGKQAPSR